MNIPEPIANTININHHVKDVLLDVIHLFLQIVEKWSHVCQSKHCGDV